MNEKVAPGFRVTRGFALAGRPDAYCELQIVVTTNVVAAASGRRCYFNKNRRPEAAATAPSRWLASRTPLEFRAGKAETENAKPMQSVPAVGKNEHPRLIVSRPTTVCGVRAALIFGFFCLLGATSIFSHHSLAVPLRAAEAAAAVEGTVKSNSGQPLSGVNLALRNAASVLRAITDVQGKFRLAPVRPGTYSLSVKRVGYLSLVRSGIVVSGGAPLILNLVLKSQSSVSLGEVRFDQKSGFETGELRDPTAGGGYSDSASLESARMARQYSRQAAGKSPKNPGEEMLARGEYAQAASWFLNTGRPRSARDEMGLGIAYYGQGKYDAAVETLHKAATLAPDDAAPRLLMAEAARFAPSRQAMVADSLRGFTLAHPANAEGHYAYGMVLWAIFRAQHLQSALALARTESERAVALAPGNAAAHVQLGTIYDRMNMVSEAIAQYRQALKANPDFSAAHYRLAQDLLRTGAKSEAQAQIQAYEKLEKDGGR